MRNFNPGNIILCIIVFICFVFNAGTANARKIDSLLSALKEHAFDDTTHVLLLAKVANGYRYISADSMIVFAGEGLALAEKINYGEGKNLCNMQLGTASQIKNNYEKAISYFNDVYANSIKISNLKDEAIALHNIGNCYFSQEKYGVSVDYYNKSKAISEQINDIKNVALELIGIGMVHKELGNYALAIQFYLDGLKMQEKDRGNKNIANTLTDIGTVYSLMGEYKKALGYLNQSIVIDHATGNSYGELDNIVNEGVVNGEMKDYPAALAAFNQGLHLADSLGDVFWKTTCQANIAEAYFYLGDYKHSYDLYTQTLDLAKKIREFNTVTASEGGIGNILIKEGKITEGINHLQAAYAMTQKNGMKEPMYQIVHDLSDAYEQMHDYKHALQYHKIYFDLRDTMYNEKNEKKVQQLEFDYELGKKENQIQLLEKDKLIDQSRVLKQRVILWALIFGLALLALIIFILFRSRAQMKKSKDNMLRQKEEIQQQAQKLEDLNRFKDKTFSVLSHDLRGPLNAISATISMLDEDLISPEEFASLKPEVNGQLASLNNLVENLLNWAKSYIKGQTNALPEETIMNRVVGQIIKFVQSIADKKGIKITNSIPESILVFCDPVQLEIVIRNLVMNALKFTNHNGSITLSATTEKDKVKISIEDTGVGMTAEQLKKLFTPVSGANTYGTDGETGTGLGLLLCYEFIKANNGRHHRYQRAK